MTGELRLKSSKWPLSEVYAGQFFSTPWYAIPWNEFWMLASVLQDFSIFRWTRVDFSVFKSRFQCFHVDKSRPWELTASFSPPAPVLNPPVQHRAEPYSGVSGLNFAMWGYQWYCGIVVLPHSFWTFLNCAPLCCAEQTTLINRKHYTFQSHASGKAMQTFHRSSQFVFFVSAYGRLLRHERYGRHTWDTCPFNLSFLIPAWTPLFTFTFFHLLFLLFTLLLWVLLVPARQLLANPPVAKHPAADSNLRDFYQQPTTEELSERVDKGSKSNEWYQPYRSKVRHTSGGTW